MLAADQRGPSGLGQGEQAHGFEENNGLVFVDRKIDVEGAHSHTAYLQAQAAWPVKGSAEVPRTPVQTVERLAHGTPDLFTRSLTRSLALELA
jgi:hypothetical protein